ncbi:MAG: putative membrane protein YeaQ/YmgE (transglycosylase-associated protein family) [Limisphaerales bacterium]|jgi:uncharacterized membrane protein YeaQ/YmgE (transglycosylase-associated protein family)
MSKETGQEQDKGAPPEPSKWRVRVDDTKRLIQEPAYAREYFPRIFLTAWRSRGGGWYGIGYLVTFLYLEISMTVSELMETTSSTGFIALQVAELIGRWFGESLMNMVQAFLWPARLIELVGGIAGIVILIGIHLAFEYFVRPLAETRFPELAVDREKRAEKKNKKRTRKSTK